MEKLVFLSYDLSYEGDYEGLYRWLDAHEAKECGNSVACFKFEANVADTEKFVGVLKDDIEKNVSIKQKDRMYIIMYVNEGGRTSMNGKFLIGARKGSPWQGYASKQLLIPYPSMYEFLNTQFCKKGKDIMSQLADWIGDKTSLMYAGGQMLNS